MLTRCDPAPAPAFVLRAAYFPSPVVVEYRQLYLFSEIKCSVHMIEACSGLQESPKARVLRYEEYYPSLPSFQGDRSSTSCPAIQYKFGRTDCLLAPVVLAETSSPVTAHHGICAVRTISSVIRSHFVPKKIGPLAV